MYISVYKSLSNYEKKWIGKNKLSSNLSFLILFHVGFEYPLKINKYTVEDKVATVPVTVLATVLIAKLVVMEAAIVTTLLVVVVSMMVVIPSLW